MRREEVLSADAQSEISELEKKISELESLGSAAGAKATRISSGFERFAWFTEIDGNSLTFQEFKVAFDMEFDIKAKVRTIREQIAELERPFHEALAAEREACWQKRGVDNAKIGRSRSNWWDENRGY